VRSSSQTILPSTRTRNFATVSIAATGEGAIAVAKTSRGDAGSSIENVAFDGAGSRIPSRVSAPIVVWKRTNAAGASPEAARFIRASECTLVACTRVGGSDHVAGEVSDATTI
jgi:hypothetical protein